MRSDVMLNLTCLTRKPSTSACLPISVVVNLVVAAILAGPRFAAAQTPGPGVPQITFSQEQLMQVLARLNATNGAPRGHGFVAMHNGYLAVLFSNDGGGGNGSGGFAFFDISNPFLPRNVFTTHNNPAYGPNSGNDPGEIREPHAFSFSGDHVCIPTRRGLQFWDFSQVGPPSNRPEKVGEIFQLPGVGGGDYTSTPWWVFWQGGRYVYVAGTTTGLHIVDASNPAQPVMVDRGAGRPNPIPVSQTGGFRAGTVFAVGNLLVITGNDASGMATFDISDPGNPVLTHLNGGDVGYSAMVNGNLILGAHDPARVWRILDNNAVTFVDLAPDVGGRGGYGMFQDGYLHLGSSSVYLKLDIRTPGAYRAFGGLWPIDGGTDLDFATAIGNLAFVGDDHGVASTYITAHQREPDTTPPAVNMVVPRPDTVNQALTSRVGLTFTDQIDLRTVNPNTFTVRRIGGVALPGGYSHQFGIVNFWPDQPLDPDTTYEIVVPAGGIADYAGNTVAEPFTSLFSTGNEIVRFDVLCDLSVLPPAWVGDTVELDVIACTGATQSALYSWEAGDGSPPTPFLPTTGVTHTYLAPGCYTVTLTARDVQSNVQRTFSTTQLIAHPPTPQAPSSAGPIVYDAARNHVWNVNQDNNSITVIDTLTLARLAEIPVGKTPRTLAIAPDGTVWVTNQDDATISVIDGLSAQPLDTITLPFASRPYGLGFSPTGDAAYVTLEAVGKLARLDPASRTLLDTTDVGPHPRGLAVSHDGQRVLITRFISPSDHGQVVEIDSGAMTVSRTYALAFDPGPDREDSGQGVPNYLFSIAISPDGRRAWCPSKKDNTTRGLFRNGMPLTFENTVRAIVSQIDLVAGGEDLDARRDLNDRALASAVTFSPQGHFAYVTTTASNTVEIFSAACNELVAGIADVGLAPDGLTLNADGSRLFVHNFMSRDVAVYDVSDVGNSNQTPLIARIDTVVQEKLDPRVLAGKQIFYNSADNRMSRDNYLSCATCHFDGDSDGRVWDFTDRGEGVRKTISLLGRAGMRHGPVHWSANFDEIQDFEHDIRDAFGGEGLMSDTAFFQGTRRWPLGDLKRGHSAELDMLARYVASLTRVPTSPFRLPDGRLTPQAVAGQALFHSPEVGCADCHSGARFTESTLLASPFVLRNVGTLTAASGQRLGNPLIGLDAPTLKGVWWTPPYLHDGSAETLMDVITTANPGDVHGRTSQLTDTQRQQLISYVQQIDNTAPADFDGDGDVDQTDFGTFQRCHSGSTVHQPLPACTEPRLDEDEDVDQNDFGIFQGCISGPNLPADPNCAN